MPLEHPAVSPPLYHQSRYATEFEECEFLAKGGFGAVYKARNRLDNCHYAVKKIVLKRGNADTFAKILREVITLASLAHPNIVCYKTAWLEPYLSASTPPVHLEVNSLTFEESSSSFKVEFESEKKSSFGIIFKDSSGENISRRVPGSLSLHELDPDDDSHSVDKIVGLASSPPPLSCRRGKFWDASSEGDKESCGMSPYWPKALMDLQKKKLDNIFERGKRTHSCLVHSHLIGLTLVALLLYAVCLGACGATGDRFGPRGFFGGKDQALLRPS